MKTIQSFIQLAWRVCSLVSTHPSTAFSAFKKRPTKWISDHLTKYCFYLSSNNILASEDPYPYIWLLNLLRWILIIGMQIFQTVIKLQIQYQLNCNELHCVQALSQQFHRLWTINKDHQKQGSSSRISHRLCF